MQQMFEHIFDCLYVGYGIHIKSWEIIILFSMCRYAQSCAFISVIELPRIPAYCPKIIINQFISFYPLCLSILLFHYSLLHPQYSAEQCPDTAEILPYRNC